MNKFSVHLPVWGIVRRRVILVWRAISCLWSSVPRFRSIVATSLLFFRSLVTGIRGSAIAAAAASSSGLWSRQFTLPISISVVVVVLAVVIVITTSKASALEVKIIQSRLQLWDCVQKKTFPYKCFEKSMIPISGLHKTISFSSLFTVSLNHPKTPLSLLQSRSEMQDFCYQLLQIIHYQFQQLILQCK